jgi:hypothetical protein
MNVTKVQGELRRSGPSSHKEWTASLHSGHRALAAGSFEKQ